MSSIWKLIACAWFVTIEHFKSLVKNKVFRVNKFNILSLKFITKISNEIKEINMFKGRKHHEINIHLFIFMLN